MNSIIFIIVMVFLSISNVSCQPPDESNLSQSEHILYGYPSTEEPILYRQGYVLSHDNTKKVANWVSYHLTEGHLEGDQERTDDFRPDPELGEGERSELSDYRSSGYDRGHLAPAGDMKRSEEVMSESFLLSNMAPQVGPGFNRGIWRILEAKVREWAEERHSIHVMTGPLYLDEEGEPTDEYDTIGDNEVAIPTHFFKIVVAGSPPHEIEAIAFILPNERNDSDRLPEFITSIDEVEELSGLDFLHELDDRVEDPLEANVEDELW